MPRTTIRNMDSSSPHRTCRDQPRASPEDLYEFPTVVRSFALSVVVLCGDTMRELNLAFGNIRGRSSLSFCLIELLDRASFLRRLSRRGVGRRTTLHKVRQRCTVPKRHPGIVIARD